MRDRLGDLQPSEEEAKQQEATEAAANKKKQKKDKQIKKTNELNSPTKPEADMNLFFEELADMKSQIASIRNSVDEIRAIHDKALNSVTSEKQSAEMDVINKQLKKKDPNGNDVTIRISQHGVLTSSFLEVMTEYKKIQEGYQNKFKDRMQRQALIVKPNATKEEIEKMMDGEGQMFAKQIVNSSQRVEAKKALEDIQNKHREVQRIEKSILELGQLFADMAVLVQAQGEVIDQIAVHIDNAVVDTEEGVQAMSRAVKIQKKTRKPEDGTNTEQKKKSLFGKTKTAPEKQTQDAIEKTNKLNDFFEEVEKLKELISQINFGVRSIAELYGKSLNAITDKQSADVSSELDKEVAKVKESANTVHIGLKEMDLKIRELKKSDPDGQLTMRKSQYDVLLKQFMQCMERYQAEQHSYQEKSKERMKKQAQVVNPNATEAEIEALVDGGRVFDHKFENTQHRIDVKNALEDINRKHLEVAKVEQSIKELQQLFIDMNVLITAQGEKVDSITDNIGNAANDVESGVNSMAKAVKIQKKNRKRYMCIMLFGAIALALIITLVALLKR
ncbi:Syntaxin-1A [Globomyces sp. JEL0801]|nr:Syntaxin-1A [Globomyces sp. JEL0801]